MKAPIKKKIYIYLNDTLFILHVVYNEVVTVIHGDMYCYSWKEKEYLKEY